MATDDVDPVLADFIVKLMASVKHEVYEAFLAGAGAPIVNPQKRRVQRSQRLTSDASELMVGLEQRRTKARLTTGGIARVLGRKSNERTGPLKRLLVTGKPRETGVRRGTAYHPN
jgi:hypothetical protein